MPVIFPRLSYFVADFKYFLVLFTLSLIVSIVIFNFRRNRITLLSVSIFLSLITCFLLLEVYFRYIFDQTDNVYQLKTSQRWVQRHVQWNSDGYRDRHFAVDKNPNEKKILFLGDSYTFGHGIKSVESRYVELLGQKLQSQCSSGKTITTYNLGLPGNQSITHLQILNTTLPRYRPDAIVMEYYLDDIDGDKFVDQDPGFEAKIFAYKKNPLLNFALSRSYALEYLYFRLLFLIRPDIDWGVYINFNESLYRNAQVWQRHVATLTSIINLTRQYNIPLVVFILPLSHRLGPEYPLADIHQSLTRFFTAQKVPNLDLLPLLNQYPKLILTVNKFDYHLNEFGQTIIADNLYQSVKDMPAFQCR
jgi:hypothetical protein